MSLNSLHNGNFEAFGGAMARATWAWQPLRGSPWVLKYLIVTKSSPKPILGAAEGFHETSNSIAFGKPTSQRIYPERHTPQIGWKLHKYGLKHALHTLDDHFR